MQDIKISKNFLIGGLTFLLTGFILMAIGSDTYSLIKISLSPVLLTVGYVLVAYSIMKKKA